MVWLPHPSGEYSAISVWHVIRKVCNKVAWWSLVRFKHDVLGGHLFNGSASRTDLLLVAVCHFVLAPHSPHWAVLFQILCYVRGTNFQSLILSLALMQHQKSISIITVNR